MHKLGSCLRLICISVYVSDSDVWLCWSDIKVYGTLQESHNGANKAETSTLR